VGIPSSEHQGIGNPERSQEDQNRVVINGHRRCRLCSVQDRSSVVSEFASVGVCAYFRSGTGVDYLSFLDWCEGNKDPTPAIEDNRCGVREQWRDLCHHALHTRHGFLAFEELHQVGDINEVHGVSLMLASLIAARVL
jgi:hypothetical protein